MSAILDLDSIIERLRSPVGEISTSTTDDPGIYAIFIRQVEALAALSINADGLLYIGMTKSSLTERNHLHHQHSGFSTLRRSIGAILKEALTLRPVPRAPGPSPTNALCYRFQDTDEQRLSCWMSYNLAFRSDPQPLDQTEAIEKALILRLEPPLNLKGWQNPQGRHIKMLRKRCADEARGSK